MLRAHLVLFVLALSFPSFADSGLLTEVQELHAAGRTEEALEKLDQPSLKESMPGLYFYNRGVLLHALNRYGLAVASFEKARSLSPGRGDIEEALATSRRELGQLIGPARLDPASLLIEKVGDEIPFEPFLVFFSGLSLLGILVILVKKKGFRSRVAVLTYVQTGLLMAFFFWRSWMIAHPGAMVIQPVTLRSGPGTDYLEMGNLEVGAKVRLEQDGGEWLKVRYAADQSLAFIPRSSLLLLTEE